MGAFVASFPGLLHLQVLQNAKTFQWPGNEARHAAIIRIAQFYTTLCISG